ncbi:TlpA disulfide reductase family protein [Oricola sp.]|uniref:TlpA disulfide reductase family protein n=1 Tax=Oricola sp. TaxID=1979950 RepID=UPI0025E53EB3|nr:TlpA disulfide reductase family protein [Oricola sp.]MCI5077407.1 TlpA family protein disulfide reductase [Oricola sp.]
MRALRVALALLALTTGAVRADGVFAPVEPRPAASADVEIVNSIGKTHVLADFLPVGEAAILHFWATWCGPCREELPGLASYAQALSDDGLRDRLIVIAVEPSPREKIDRFLDDLGLAGFVTLQDRKNRSGPLFGLFGMPATILLDAEGRVVGQHSGPLDWDDAAIRTELAAHLDG